MEALKTKNIFFSKKIKSLFLSLKKWDWKKNWTGIVFFRDYQYLPFSSPKDIDIIIEKSKQKKFLLNFKKQANLFGLYCYTYQTKENSFILIFDIENDAPARNWAFLEIRDRIRINEEKIFFSYDIEIKYHPELGIPVPQDHWVSFLECIQAVRKNNFKKMEKNLLQSNISLRHSKELFKKFLKLNINFNNKKEAFNKISKVIYLNREKKVNAITLIFKIKKWFFKRFYFIHFIKPNLFTINGPDGVGKTTVIREINKIFDKLPLNFATHHHITSWKKKLVNKNNEVRHKVSIKHILLRFIYRKFFPQFLKDIYIQAQNYHYYLKRVNQLLYNETMKHNIVLLDRYIYDLGIKNILKNKSNWLINKIFFKSAMPVKKIYNLNDNAKSILKRKKELSFKEINLYQDLMLKILSKNKTEFTSIKVGAKKPKEIAIIIVTDIMNTSGDEIFSNFKYNQESIIE